jgi:hypothetical protein
MEFGLFSFGVIVGIGSSFLWLLIINGQKEGNRLDYIIKITKLKQEKEELKGKVLQFESLLQVAYEENKEQKAWIYAKEIELDNEHQKTMELKRSVDQKNAYRNYKRATAF